MSGAFGLGAAALALWTLAGPPAGCEPAEALGESSTLSVGDELEVPRHLRLTFLDVLGDSRCPVDVTCIRAGEATLLLGIELEQGETLEETIDVPPNARVAFDVPGYRVEILALEPEPRSTESLEKEAYRLTLRIVARSDDARSGV